MDHMRTVEEDKAFETSDDDYEDCYYVEEIMEEAAGDAMMPSLVEVQQQDMGIIELGEAVKGDGESENVEEQGEPEERVNSEVDQTESQFIDEMKEFGLHERKQVEQNKQIKEEGSDVESGKQLTENSLKEDGRPERSANGIGDEAEIKVNKVFEQGEQLKSVSMDSAFVNVVGSNDEQVDDQKQQLFDNGGIDTKKLLPTVVDGKEMEEKKEKTNVQQKLVAMVKPMPFQSMPSEVNQQSSNTNDNNTNAAEWSLGQNGESGSELLLAPWGNEYLVMVWPNDAYEEDRLDDIAALNQGTPSGQPPSMHVITTSHQEQREIGQATTSNLISSSISSYAVDDTTGLEEPTSSSSVIDSFANSGFDATRISYAGSVDERRDTVIEIASNAVQQTDQQEVQQYQPQSVMNVTNGTASNDVQQQVVTLQAPSENAVAQCESQTQTVKWIYSRETVKRWFEEQKQNTLHKDGYRYEYAFRLAPFSRHFAMEQVCAQRTVDELFHYLGTFDRRVLLWWDEVNWMFKRNQNNHNNQDEFDACLYICSANLDCICDLYRLIRFGIHQFTFEWKELTIATAKHQTEIALPN